MVKVYTNFEPLLLASLLFEIEAGAHGRRPIKESAHCSTGDLTPRDTGGPRTYVPALLVPRHYLLLLGKLNPPAR